MNKPAEHPEPSHPSSSPFAALAAGYLVWLLGIILTASLASGGPWNAISNSWLLAFLAGAVVCFLVLALQAIRSGSGAPWVLDGFGAYALPVSLLVVGWEAVGSVYRSPARDQAFAETAPLVMLFASGLGLLLGSWLVRRRGREFLIGAVLPPAVMAVATVGYFAFGTFTSDDFRYRDAFTFGVLEAARDGDDVRAECVFTILKPGEYTYMVSHLASDTGDADHPGEMIWKEGAPTAAGEYPVTLIWRGASSAISGVGAIGDPASGAGLWSRPYFGVNRRDGDGERLVRTFSIPLAAGASDQPGSSKYRHDLFQPGEQPFAISRADPQ